MNQNGYKKHKNIPFFIPHAGCPHDCVFCSQSRITGKARACDPNPDSELSALKSSIEEALATIKGSGSVQLAFFGGSFTAIERERMLSLLKAGHSYIKEGRINSIRISTRPDCINTEILDLLKEYGVTDIELGIQSTDDRVLALSGRGHTAADSVASARLVREAGFGLVGQMMLGLPGSDIDSEIKTAKAIINMGAYGARIYPAVVFGDTPLFLMAKNGAYTPLTDEQAVTRGAACLELFASAGVKTLRIGLQATEGLMQAEYGANHPAIGELVKARVLRNRIEADILRLGAEGKRIKITVNRTDSSKIYGHGGIIGYLSEKFGLAGVKVGYDVMPEYGVKTEIINLG